VVMPASSPKAIELKAGKYDLLPLMQGETPVQSIPAVDILPIGKVPASAPFLYFSMQGAQICGFINVNPRNRRPLFVGKRGFV
jgi:hypothetical protein